MPHAASLRSSLLPLALAACATRAPTPVAVRSLAGVLDTVLAVSGAPYGAAAAPGVALVTRHHAAALARWDFRRRTLDVDALATGQEPTNVAIASDGRSAFVASQLSFRIDRIDLTRGLVEGAWPTPANAPYQVAVSRDGRSVYATGNAGFLYLFDAATGRAGGAVRVSDAPNGLVVSPDGREVFVTHLRSSDIGVVDVRTKRYRVLGDLGAEEGQGIALSPDGTVVYAVSENAGDLVALDARTGSRIARVPTGPSPFGVAITPDGSELWVTTLMGRLLRFHRADLSPIDTQVLGGRLRRLAFEPSGMGAVIADEEGRLLVMR